MTESLQHIDRSCVFRETFDSAFDVSNNRYGKGSISSTGVKFENGVTKFDGVSGKITYRLVKGNSFRFKIYPLKNNQIVCRLNSTQSVSINNVNQIVGNNFISPVYYVNGNNTQNITLNSWNEIVIITTTTIKCTDFQIGYNTTYYNGHIELGEWYNRAISASEIKLLYQQQLYSVPQQLPLLLDFDSTRGVLEDKTGKNKLTATNIDIKRIGKVYSAWFNGISSVIDITSSSVDISTPKLISIWYKVFKGKDIVSIFSSRDYNSSNNTINVRTYNTTNNRWTYIYIKNNSGTFVDGIYATTTANAYRNIINLCIYYSYTKVYFFINGLLSATYNINIINNVSNPSKIFQIGNTSGSSGYNMKGYIPKLQIFDATNMNDNQVSLLATQLYNSQRNLFNV